MLLANELLLRRVACAQRKKIAPASEPELGSLAAKAIPCRFRTVFLCDLCRLVTVSEVLLGRDQVPYSLFLCAPTDPSVKVDKV